MRVCVCVSVCVQEYTSEFIIHGTDTLMLASFVFMLFAIFLAHPP